MLELIFCSLLTIFPDYLFRRYVQGKRIGKEITFYSVWFELRWGITGCVILTISLITVVFNSWTCLAWKKSKSHVPSLQSPLNYRRKFVYHWKSGLETDPRGWPMRYRHVPRADSSEVRPSAS